MVTEKSERPLMESGHGVRYVTAKLCRQRQGCELSGPKPLGLERSQMGIHNRLWLLALASVLIAGCSKSNSPPPVERDPCLDAGPAKSVEYDNCVADREASKREALRALLDDTGVYSRQMQIVESEDNAYQPPDFPDAPIPMVYKGAVSCRRPETVSGWMKWRG